jgi:hypothetical protein
MTTGWWSQYAANPTLEPYASYLNFVIPATRAVASPTITPEGVVRRETPSEPGAGGGSAAEGSSTSDTGGQPNVGQAAYGAAHSTALGGANTMGGVNLALTLAGIPSIATTLFAGTNMLTGALMGLNTDPESGLAVGGKAFAALAAGAPWRVHRSRRALALATRLGHDRAARCESGGIFHVADVGGHAVLKQSRADGAWRNRSHERHRRRRDGRQYQRDGRHLGDQRCARQYRRWRK